jgi:hypothetical protein
MNESNLEHQLRKWNPRPPSERVRETLFGERLVSTEAIAGLRLGELLRWLVPVLGCFLLVIVSLSPRPNQVRYAGIVATNNARGMLAVEESIRSHGSINDPNTEQNAIPHATLEWTFGPRSSSSMVSLINFKTNTLKH